MSTIFEGVTPNKQEIKKVEGNEKNKVNEIGNIEILYESEKSETLLDWSQIVNIVKKASFSISENLGFAEINEKAEKVSAHDISEPSFIENVLNEAERIKIKEKINWSNKVIDCMHSVEEYNIYEKASLKEATINKRSCLIRMDIDWTQMDSMGRSNQERISYGLSPINRDGKIIELHHIGQKSDSPFAELTSEEHRGKGNDKILHRKTIDSEINRIRYASEKSQHWTERAENL